MKSISTTAVAAPLNTVPKGFSISSLAARAAVFARPDSLQRFACVLFLYGLASAVGNALNRTPGIADILWPANGLLLAFLLPIARRYWPSYLAASIAVNVLVHIGFGFSLQRALLYSAANTIEVLVAGFLLGRPEGLRPDLTRLGTLARFVGYAVLLAPITSTGFNEAVLALWTYPRHPKILTDWLAGDMMGMALMAPLFLAINREELSRLFSAAKRLETIAILAGVALVSAVVFTQNGLPLDFLVLPALLVAIFRLRGTGGALAILLIAAPAVYMTERNHGVFAAPVVVPGRHDFLILQLFLCVSVVIVYAVNAALSVRDRLHVEMREAFQQANTLANRDYITGLANRLSFDHQLTREWLNSIQQQGTISLLLVDVDQFKLYNDHYGHMAGDQCLRSIANALANAARRSTDIVARYGGEEFALILPNAPASGALVLAERIRQAVVDAQIPHLPYTSGFVTVSVGVATLYPQPGQEKCALVLCADRALYSAKQAGRNRIEAWDADAPNPIEDQPGYYADNHA